MFCLSCHVICTQHAYYFTNDGHGKNIILLKNNSFAKSYVLQNVCFLCFFVIF